MIDIVVAHYNEELSWIKNLKIEHVNKIYIYSKYEAKQNKPGVRRAVVDEKFMDQKYFHQLSNKVEYKHKDNIGRESETYLSHCVEQYHNLAEHTIFLQGEPHVHWDYINSLLDRFQNGELDVSDNSEWFWGVFLDGHIGGWYGATDASNYNFYTWFRTYVDQEIHLINGFPVYYGACFGVGKKQIQSRSIAFYQKIINNELQTVNPECGHFLERLWFYIFNCHIIKQ